MGDRPGAVDVGWSLAFLRARAVPGLEAVGADWFARPHRVDGRIGVITVTVARAERGNPVTAAGDAGIAPAAATDLARRQLGLERDLTPFLAMATRDSILRPLTRGVAERRLPRLLDPFEALIRAIVGQQVSVAGATTLLGRLVARFGEPLPDGRWRAFPAPERLARARPETLGRLGLTRARAATIRTAAAAALRGDLDWTADPATLERALVALPGVGPWTAGYVRLRGLGDPDAFLPTDLGVVKALTALGVPEQRIVAVTDRWRPWRGWAMPYLWGTGNGEREKAAVDTLHGAGIRR